MVVLFLHFIPHVCSIMYVQLKKHFCLLRFHIFLQGHMMSQGEDVYIILHCKQLPSSYFAKVLFILSSVEATECMYSFQQQKWNVMSVRKINHLLKKNHLLLRCESLGIFFFLWEHDRYWKSANWYSYPQSTGFIFTWVINQVSKSCMVRGV